MIGLDGGRGGKKIAADPRCEWEGGVEAKHDN